MGRSPQGSKEWWKPEGPGLWIQYHVYNIGLTLQVAESTNTYAEWSVAAELRLLSKEGVFTEKRSGTDIKECCGRGAATEDTPTKDKGARAGES